VLYSRQARERRPAHVDACLGCQTRRHSDFDIIALDEHGHGIYGPPENGESYPAVSALCERFGIPVPNEYLPLQ
jgi:hypothetical protein